MNSYFELKIKINPQIEEVVSDIFFHCFDCKGVVLEEQTYKDLEIVSTTCGTLKAFLTSLPHNYYEILQTQKSLLKSRGLSDDELGSWEITLDEKENQDWSYIWKKHWTVTNVTEKIIVVPSWIEYKSKKDEIVLILDPGCAFGTGTHQTTQLCMKALEKYLKKGDKMADIGTGSGILSILTKKLGASYVYGCDIDETVIDVAKENAKINKTECIFELNSADKINDNYDFVCANILHNVLVEIMGDLKKLLKPHGILCLSGILEEKTPAIIDAIKENNLKIIDTMQQDQWVSYIVSK